MKKTLMILAIAVSAWATQVSAKEIKRTDKSFSHAREISLQLDLGDISKMPESEVRNKVEKFIRENISEKSTLTCTVSVKGTLNVAAAKFEITVTVTGPCSEVAKAGKQMASDLLEQAKIQLKKVF